MATGPPLLPVKLELPATPVQELIKTTGNRIPERYIFHPNNESNSQSSLPFMESPVIDLQLLVDSSSTEGQEELRKLRCVLSSWGCFQLINSGLSSSELDQLREIGKEFFELPVEEKQKYSRTETWFEGYGSDTVAENEPYNWNDRLHLKIYPVDQRNLKLWPEILPNFRRKLDEYAVNTRRVLELMLKAIARSLELEEMRFLSHFGEDGIMFSRFNYYPPCRNPDKVYGLKPHSDVTLLTILLQDKVVEGLQVLKDNQWFRVPIVPDALFINAGDQLEILSNGVFKSVVHKVVIDKEKERISVAVASSPSTDKEVGPLGELIDKERPQLYKKVQNYMAIFLQHIARGERAIDAIKIPML